MKLEIPTHCRNGHELGPGRISLSWRACGCPGAQSGGHQVVYCGVTGCWPAVAVIGHVGDEPEPERMPSYGH